MGMSLLFSPFHLAGDWSSPTRYLEHRVECTLAPPRAPDISGASLNSTITPARAKWIHIVSTVSPAEQSISQYAVVFPVNSLARLLPRTDRGVKGRSCDQRRRLLRQEVGAEGPWSRASDRLRRVSQRRWFRRSSPSWRRATQSATCATPNPQARARRLMGPQQRSISPEPFARAGATRQADREANSDAAAGPGQHPAPQGPVSAVPPPRGAKWTIAGSIAFCVKVQELDLLVRGRSRPIVALG
jgi:hypothetical protein